MSMNLFDLDKKFKFTGSALPKAVKGLPADELEYINEQKEVRRQLGLPVTKELVYYYHPYNKNSQAYSVTSYDARRYIDNFGNECSWNILEIQVMGDDEPKIIHGDFFAEMQKPNFVEYIENVVSED